jgi:hypothetical protein
MPKDFAKFRTRYQTPFVYSLSQTAAIVDRPDGKTAV